MTQKLEIIRDFCDQCGGSGDVSSCCSAEFDDGRCSECGRFCIAEHCHNCEGQGFTEYSLGDEVDIFVCVWSEDYLKEQLYVPKEVGDTKDFSGVIVELVDNWNVIVKVGKKLVNVKIEDIGI